MGAWIETLNKIRLNSMTQVAPRVGAWIETNLLVGHNIYFESHPVWVRGLKPMKKELVHLVLDGRTPCGCVD